MGGMIHFVELLRTPVGALVGLVVVIMFAFYVRWLLSEPDE